MDSFATCSAWWAPLPSFFLAVVIWGRAGTTGWTNRLPLGFTGRFTAAELKEVMATSGRPLHLELSLTGQSLEQHYEKRF